ncbi:MULTISPECIES: NAD(P)-binding domain-containing protein [Bacillus]|uniref:Flavoprotein n=2 Tax=Bacillus TaxID=1386 RepID=A0A0M4FSZ0_9BACI|nr:MULTISPECIES: NAD(P)-binding domain-containing protein [Bacillus]ALC81193.1 flavoprotein [Bacillus gobiensis]MBP1080175.1 thioredoxin reductase [Bacillus capparidis]MED1094049.1 NAD(P)-binding domain-containing protein [Bacillus capparidis]
MSANLPTVIIGAGPVGLAAAAHLNKYGQSYLILEKGSKAGSNILEWGHVQLFSPWEFNIDQAAKELLLQTEWKEPEASKLPKGIELVNEYLKPLANLPQLKENIIYHAEVTAITKKNMDKIKSALRDEAPFVIYANVNGITKKFEAKAVIDASGTWNHPNPPFADGIWRNEELKKKVHTNIPNVKRKTELFKNKHVAVIGSGHSALNTLIDLTELIEEYPDTKISWIIRKQQVQEAFGGEENDELAARGALGSKTHQIVDNGLVTVFTGFNVEEIIELDGVFTIESSKGVSVSEIDEIIVNTGARPNFTFLKELRIDVDPIVESTTKLAPLIDPNLHSCGTVRPHGEKELRQPEQNFYITGVKSYGRAPTFLMATGYEQVRSIAAYISGDIEEATKVNLQLPETGVCRANPTPKQLQIIGINDGSSCCGSNSSC